MWSGKSLRFWIAIAMAIAVLPLAASAGLGYVLISHGVLASFQDVAARQRDEIDPTQRLRLLLWDAVAPVDDFTDEGDPRQPQAYRAIRQQIEENFASLHSNLQSEGELRTLVERARDDWTAADRVAGEVISVRRAPGDAHGEQLMDGFHALIASSVDKLGAVYSGIAVDVRSDHEEAMQSFKRSEWLAAGAALLSLMAILAGAVTIGRITAGSVDRLVDGAERFAAGDRAHRIEIQVPPELHRVAEEFNRMIGRIHESEDALASLARRDGLTQMLNRRAFDEELVEMYAKHARMGETFALLMLDLDHFKRINDTYGHSAGDDVLRAASQAMASGLRSFDHVFRIGGEEFAAILPGADAEAARMTAERLREAVASRAVNINGKQIFATASLGVATHYESSAPASLVEAADAALYRAKTEGRNRVVVSGDGTLAFNENGLRIEPSRTVS
jgi:diguanylate cyclase (GGDEF)-like protein